MRTVQDSDMSNALAWVRHRLDCDVTGDDLRARGKTKSVFAVARLLAIRELSAAGYTAGEIAVAIDRSRQYVAQALKAMPPRASKP